MIHYDETRVGENSIMVKINGKLTGHIKKVQGGYQYIVKGGKYKGDIFPTVFEVKQSLEDD